MRRFYSTLAGLILVAVLPCSPAVASDPIPPELSAESIGDAQGVKVTASDTQSSTSPPPVYDLSGEVSSLPGGGSVQVQPAVAEDFCDHIHRDIATNHPCWLRLTTNPEDEPPTEDEIAPLSMLYTAVAVARIDGAGLVVEPSRDWVYKDIPTLAHARHQTLTTTAAVFNLNIPITFTATNYVFDFHSGEQPIHTTTPGLPYPDMSIHSVYRDEHPAQHVTLTTLWDAEASHPLTGQTLHIPGALRTVEHSPTFRVIRSRHRLISPEEFNTTH